jgi:hypothetical protein
MPPAFVASSLYSLGTRNSIRLLLSSNPDIYLLKPCRRPTEKPPLYQMGIGIWQYGSKDLGLGVWLFWVNSVIAFTDTSLTHQSPRPVLIITGLQRWYIRRRVSKAILLLVLESYTNAVECTRGVVHYSFTFSSQAWHWTTWIEWVHSCRLTSESYYVSLHLKISPAIDSCHNPFALPHRLASFLHLNWVDMIVLMCILAFLPVMITLNLVAISVDLLRGCFLRVLLIGIPVTLRPQKCGCWYVKSRRPDNAPNFKPP